MVGWSSGSSMQYSTLADGIPRVTDEEQVNFGKEKDTTPSGITRSIRKTIPPYGMHSACDQRTV